MKFILLLIVSVINASTWAEIYVIAHKQSTINQLNHAQLKEIYLGNRQFIADVRVLPLDQDIQESTRHDFYTQVINIDQSQLISHWSKLIFTGKGQAPKSLLADQSIIDFVSANPNTIGYIKSQSMNDKVKIIYQAILN